jgi:hypothetical protein
VVGTEKNGMASNHVFDVIDTIPPTPLQPLPRAHPPQLRCHQPPVVYMWLYIHVALDTTLFLCKCPIHIILLGQYAWTVPMVYGKYLWYMVECRLDLP